MLLRCFLALSLLLNAIIFGEEGLPLFYWKNQSQDNFGDVLSKVLVERIVQAPVQCYVKKGINQKQKLLAIGSILFFANEGDVVWGSGLHGKMPERKFYHFEHLDVRSVRGPLTREFLMNHFYIDCPEIYGDPALLFPYFFPEFQKSPNPSRDYIIIPHYTDEPFFRDLNDEHVVYTTDPWEQVLAAILDSKFVITSSLHGIILAEAYGIPAQMLRLQESPHNPLLKYHDYYLGTNRTTFHIATSIDEALHLKGEPPYSCNLQQVYEAFPFEYWPDTTFYQPDFNALPCFSCP